MPNGMVVSVLNADIEKFVIGLANVLDVIELKAVVENVAALVGVDHQDDVLSRSSLVSGDDLHERHGARPNASVEQGATLG